ncbi:MAG: DUF134 domain-containing protein [Anaerovoracaceae bacterium]
MPRPQRRRRVCSEPEYTEFIPRGSSGLDITILYTDEYEVIRLVDFEKKTHEQCAAQMDISRTTVTEIYERARFKLADSIVNGKILVIEGGNYRLCGGTAAGCCGRTCINNLLSSACNVLAKKGGDNIMRIAVTYENGQIFQHFGHTEHFKVYDVQDGKIISQKLIDTNGSGHGALAGFLAANEVDTLICGGIGGGAQTALKEAGIRLYGGVSGDADDAVKALIEENLRYNPDVHCGHHDHEHGDGHNCGNTGGDQEGHVCGSHGCK